MRFLPRVCFTLLATLALASVLGGAGCTRRGTPAVLPSGSGAPTSRTAYVNAKTGKDTNPGSQTAPFKTVTKAFAVAASPGPIAVVDVEIAAGDYNAANGEKFPLQVPGGVTINGGQYGRGSSKGTFIDGAGEDKNYEKLVGAPANSFFTTIEVAPTSTGTSFTNVYVGATTPALPATAIAYDALNDLGTLTATTTSFAGSVKRGAPRLNGVMVPGGTFTCTSCTIGGTGYGIAAFSLATSDCSSETQCPTVTLNGPSISGLGSVGGAQGIRTDGTALVTVSNQRFTSSLEAFADDYAPLISAAITPVEVDFGQGFGSPPSTGGNVLIGAGTEFSLTLPGDLVTAYGNTWNPGIQGSNKNGQYSADVGFGPGASGKNVTIASAATGAKLKTGPFKQPTPTPSTSPSGSPSASPSPSPTPTPP
jgi:hypothetical protein